MELGREPSCIAVVVVVAVVDVVDAVDDRQHWRKEVGMVVLVLAPTT